MAVHPCLDIESVAEDVFQRISAGFGSSRKLSRQTLPQAEYFFPSRNAASEFISSLQSWFPWPYSSTITAPEAGFRHFVTLFLLDGGSTLPNIFVFFTRLFCFGWPPDSCIMYFLKRCLWRLEVEVKNPAAVWSEQRMSTTNHSDLLNYISVYSCDDPWFGTLWINHTIDIISWNDNDSLISKRCVICRWREDEPFHSMRRLSTAAVNSQLEPKPNFDRKVPSCLFRLARG